MRSPRNAYVALRWIAGTTAPCCVSIFERRPHGTGAATVCGFFLADLGPREAWLDQASDKRARNMLRSTAFLKETAVLRDVFARALDA